MSGGARALVARTPIELHSVGRKVVLMAPSGAHGCAIGRLGSTQTATWPQRVVPAALRSRGNEASKGHRTEALAHQPIGLHPVGRMANEMTA